MTWSAGRYTMFPAERRLVEWLLVARRTSVVVEIGAHAGQMTQWLQATLGPHARLHVIDPWDGTQDGAGAHIYEQFLTVVDPRTTVHRARSQDVTPPADLSVVLHDGDHRDLSDLPTWWHALVPGGLLIVHDYHDPGWPAVREACDALTGPAHTYRYLPNADDVAEYGPGLRGLWWRVKP